jgi:alkylated DNA repair dioxygenase AlkB
MQTLVKENSIFYFIPNFLNEKEQNILFNYLENTSDFVPTPQFTNSISRLQKWYQVNKEYFCPTWKNRYPQWESFDIDDTINKLVNKLQNYINTFQNINIPHINSCLINKYPNGKYFIAPHRDSINSFGKEPTIINLSIGATRTLLFHNDQETLKFDLTSGSLFIMSGSSQEHYLHSIQKSDCPNVRYSFTFREFIK